MQSPEQPEVPARVSTVVVTYNSLGVVERCLDSLDMGAGNVAQEVILVDNCSTDGTVETLRLQRPSATLIANPSNRGFAQANNQGVAASDGCYIMFLNPDAALGVGTIEALVGYLEANPTVGLVAPRLVYPGGRLQHSIRRYPSLGNQLFEALSMHRLAPRLTRRFGEVVTDCHAYERSGAVDWLSGAAMLVRRSAFDSVGGFDERFFLYSEEMDLCRCLRSRGWGVCYLAEPVVVHDHGDTTRPELFRLQLTSRILYFEKHFAGVPLTALKLVTAFSLATRAALWGVLSIVRGSSALERFQSYADGVGLVLRGSQRRAGR